MFSEIVQPENTPCVGETEKGHRQPDRCVHIYWELDKQQGVSVPTRREGTHTTDTDLPQAALLFQPSLTAISALWRSLDCSLSAMREFQRFGGSEPSHLLLSECYCWSASNLKKRFAGQQLYCRLRNTYIYSWRCGALMKKDMKTVNTAYRILCPRISWFFIQKTSSIDSE